MSSSPAVSGRRRSRDMDDTVAASDAPAAGSRWVRAVMPFLVDGEIRSYEVDYQMPRTDYTDIDFLRRMSAERAEMNRVYRFEERKRARAAACSDGDDAIRRCLREARAGDAGMPEDCAVCLQDFDAEEALRVMPSCSHAFHPDCILSWLRVKPICPMCRQALPAQQEEEDDSDQDSDEDSDEEDSDSDQDDDTDAVDYQQERTSAVPDPEEP